MPIFTVSKIEDLFEKIDQNDLLTKEGYAEIICSGTIELPDLHYAYGSRDQIPIQRPIGMPNKPPGIPKFFDYPSITLTHIKNAILLPGGVIIAKGKILTDSFISEWSKDEHRFIKKVKNSHWETEKISIASTISSPVFFCDHLLADHYGEFMLNCLIRMWGVFYIKNFFNLHNISIFHTYQQPHIKEYFNLYGFDNKNIFHISEPILVKDLFIAKKALQLQDYCSPALSLCWNPIINKSYKHPDYKRIYISRSQQKSRRLLNEEKVEEFLTKQGYLIFKPENYTIAHQIAIFSNASYIIGPSGTNMFGIAFSPPDCKIMVMASEVFVHYSECFLRYNSNAPMALITGKSQAHVDPKYEGNIFAPWTVDINRFKEMSAQLNFL